MSAFSATTFVRSKRLFAIIEGAESEGRISLELVGADFIANSKAAGLRDQRDGLAYRLSSAR